MWRGEGESADSFGTTPSTWAISEPPRRNFGSKRSVQAASGSPEVPCRTSICCCLAMAIQARRESKVSWEPGATLMLSSAHSAGRSPPVA